MAEALALTRAGRLAEATRVIQATLAGKPSGNARASTMPSRNPEDVVEGTWREVTALSHDLERAPLATTRPTASQWLAGEFANAAGRRAYKLFVPAGRVGARPSLVVMLHGCKQTPDDFAAGTRMNRQGESHHSLVLYPAQSMQANATGCWNWFRTEDQQRGAGEPAILAGMTRDVMQRHDVDPAKVFVAGLSAGGAMAAVMGVTHPELFAAVGIHSGLAFGSAHDLPSALAAMKSGRAVGARPGATHSVPTIVFHGDRDKVVHPRNGAAAISASVHYNATDPGGSVETDRGGTSSGHPFTRTRHRDAVGRVMLEHWLVHGGGHAWFGGDPAGSHVDARGPDASEEMMRFFLER
jgi:poly(hydroxyalkanoate) depolymerase family esterase